MAPHGALNGGVGDSNPAVAPSTFSCDWTVTRTGGQTVVTDEA